MTHVNFQPLIEKALEDEEFGSKLIAFARDHGVDVLSDELTEDDLEKVSGGTSLSGVSSFSLDYEPTEFPKGFFSGSEETSVSGTEW